MPTFFHFALNFCADRRISSSHFDYCQSGYETSRIQGGMLFLEARDLNHAIPLMAKHPCVRAVGLLALMLLNESRREA